MKYKEEWQSIRFVNPKTGFRFKFDDYFEEIGLIVEFHGHQHYTFPNAFIPYETKYFAGQERDRIKESMVRNSPDLKFIKILEYEPFDDPNYVKAKLIFEGILKK